MTAPFSRRGFLKQGAAASAILGFPFLTQADPAAQVRRPGKPVNQPPPVDLLALARARMRQEVKPGVVIVIPPDQAMAAKLADDLARLIGVGAEAACHDQEVRGKVKLPPIGAGNSAAQVFFCQAVFVCVPFEQLRQQAPDLRPDTAAVLLAVDVYQLEGDIVLRVVEKGQPRDIPIRQGEMFLLPAGIPHSPQRPANTVGLVVERRRPEDANDHMRWFCRQCGAVVYDAEFHLVDLGKQLKPILEYFHGNADVRTCKACGAVYDVEKK